MCVCVCGGGGWRIGAGRKGRGKGEGGTEVDDSPRSAARGGTARAMSQEEVAQASILAYFGKVRRHASEGDAPLKAQVKERTQEGTPSADARTEIGEKGGLKTFARKGKKRELEECTLQRNDEIMYDREVRNCINAHDFRCRGR